MSRGLVASASMSIDAPIAKVWDALVNPELIRQYMFGTEVVSDWKIGSPIAWEGIWEGKKYEDKGTILGLEEGRLLRYSHFSSMGGDPDSPVNYHIVTLELSSNRGGTDVLLSQDNNPDEAARDHSEKNWKMMLVNLKKVLESSGQRE